MASADSGPAGVERASAPFFQVDAFAERLFAGNPAAVCPLEAWPADGLLQAIAAENNLSETAFFTGAAAGRRRLRWFTPTVEVDLCGHATLAAAHVCFTHLGDGPEPVRFETRSGELTVARRSEGGAGAATYAMDLPGTPAGRAAPPDGIAAAVGGAPIEERCIKSIHAATYVLFVYEAAAEVAALTPDFAVLARLGANVLATAPADPGGDVDFVSRFFAPAVGVDEDPVTGSAFCTLAPYWAERLGRDRLRGRQISARGGVADLMVRGDRVEVAGACVDVIQGVIALP